jgi:hypothetical protein
MKRSGVLALALAFLTVAAAVRAEECYRATIDGATAGTGSAGIGEGRFLLNDDETVLTYKVMFSGLGSAESAAHIHNDDEGGAVVKNIGTGATKIGEWTTVDAIPLTPARVMSLRAGNLYVNIHSSGFPNGEIKGYLVASACEEQCFDATLAEFAPGISTATGTARLALNHTETELAYWIEFSGLSSAETDAHIHNDAAGGAVVHPLALGSPKKGVWKWNDAQPLTGQLVKGMKIGNLYINIHTTNFPTGEIQGFLMPGNCQNTCFRAALDGAQAGTGSQATGQGYFQLSYAHNRLTYNIALTNLANETAAHIHSDAEGGGVVRGIGTGATKTGQWDYDDAQPLTLARVLALKAGQLYVNVHTVAFGGGEIKGQMGLVPCANATPVTNTPGRTSLAQNYPNPFNPGTTIAYTLASATRVRIDVYDIRGGRVATLLDGPRDGGAGEVTWNGRDEAGRAVASGVYFYRLTAGSVIETRRMVLLK